MKEEIGAIYDVEQIKKSVEESKKKGNKNAFKLEFSEKSFVYIVGNKMYSNEGILMCVLEDFVRSNIYNEYRSYCLTLEQELKDIDARGGTAAEKNALKRETTLAIGDLVKEKLAEMVFIDPYNYELVPCDVAVRRSFKELVVERYERKFEREAIRKPKETARRRKTTLEFIDRKFEEVRSFMHIGK